LNESNGPTVRDKHFAYKYSANRNTVCATVRMLNVHGRTVNQSFGKSFHAQENNKLFNYATN